MPVRLKTTAGNKWISRPACSLNELRVAIVDCCSDIAASSHCNRITEPLPKQARHLAGFHSTWPRGLRAQAELAVHLALKTDMSADQAKAALDKAGKGNSRPAFGDAMARVGTPARAFGSGNKDAVKPRLAGRMAKLLERK